MTGRGRNDSSRIRGGRYRTGCTGGSSPRWTTTSVLPGLARDTVIRATIPACSSRVEIEIAIAVHLSLRLHLTRRYHIATELASRSWHDPQLIVAEVQLPRRRELPDLSRHARQPMVAEVQLLQRRELPDLRGHARQLIVAEARLHQRRELPDFIRHARQLVAAEVQLPQRGELPISHISEKS